MSEASSPFVQQTVPSSYNSYIQPDMNYALRVWWAYYWPTTLISAIFTVLLNYEIRHIYQNTAFPAKILRPIMQFGPLVITCIVAIFVVRYLLGKTFRSFRIALLTPDFASPQPLPVTVARALRVWWFFTWRVILYSLLGTMFLIYPLGMFVGLFNPTPVAREVSAEILKFLMTAGISLYIIYSDILDEDMGDFHVALLPRVPAVEALPFS